MKGIVIYQSVTGFTETYANWIAQEMGFEAVPLSEAAQRLVLHGESCHEMVIFGGSILAGKIRGLEQMKKLGVAKGRLVVFAVGALEADEAHIRTLAKGNQIENISVLPLFYFRGGVKYEKMGFIQRALLRKVTGWKESVDLTDPKNIQPLLAALR